MTLIDTHCHLDFAQFDPDRDAVVERAVAAGVAVLINPGADLESSRRAVALAARCDRVFAAVGVHPHSATTLDDVVLDELRQLATQERVVAIGEIGLDYYRDLSPRDAQQSALTKQLELAADLGLPVIIHQRDAATDLMEALRRWRGLAVEPPIGVLHAFSGDLQMALDAVQMGFCIGVAGPVTFQNARQLPEIVAQLSAGCLVIETDAPYLSPHPHRGQRNEPAYLPLIARRVAELRNRPLAEQAYELTTTARRLFRLPC